VPVALSHSFCFSLFVADAAEEKNAQKMLGQNADLEVLSTAMVAPTATCISLINYIVCIQFVSILN